MASTTTLKRTALHAAHVEWGAKLVPFAGWEMPLQYGGIAEEHRAVREAAGLFDISHMGEFIVAGPHSETALNRALTNEVRKLGVGQAQYSLMCNERGGVIDDLIVYRVEPSIFLLVVNAGNIETDFAWLGGQLGATAVLENHSDRIAALALQGPRAAGICAELAGIGHFQVATRTIAGIECRVARTGYTGEDGFELFCQAEDAMKLWTELLARGQQAGLRPCGLGARDTLRLEMCYPLHGHDITPDTTPLEAGLGKFVAFDKGEFIGRSALWEQKQRGVTRKLAAFRMTGKCPPPRPHCAILAGQQPAGEVTSGTQSPSLGAGIGMGYVRAEVARPGAGIAVVIRDKPHPAVIETKPLLKRSP
jgi:aminomethyltransferase